MLFLEYVPQYPLFIKLNEMKTNFLLVLGICAALFTQYGCSNEVEVIGIWKDIPVVYGVIDQQKDTNYLRIERAYLPPNQSALDVAKMVDSLYFDTADVDVELYADLNGVWVPWPNPVERVDLVAEGIVRDSGIFANNPSYAYRVIGNTTLDLELRIINHKTGNTFTAYTENAFADNNGTSGPNLRLEPYYSLFSPVQPVAWRTFDNQGNEVYADISIEVLGSSFAAIYDFKFLFHYKEYDINNPSVMVSKSIEWRAVADFIPPTENQIKSTVNGEAFFRFLESNLSDVTGTNIRRCAGYLEVYADGGSASIKDYILAMQANEGFIGGLYPADPYSNVVGGYGIFGTSDRLFRKGFPSAPVLMQMSSLTYEHIRDSEITKNLGFESATPCY